MASSIQDFYPRPSKPSLYQAFVGKHLSELPTPAAILDRAIVERNCRQMLDSCESLGVRFRAHVKTHKTTEIIRMQIGQSAERARLIVSTVAEAEQLAAHFDIWSTPGAETFNILYGLPLPPSQAERLGRLAHKCGKDSISLLIDNIAQLDYLATVHHLSGHQIGLYVKIDTGYHRAGLAPNSGELKDLLTRIVDKTEASGQAYLEGFYSHAGHSYAVDSRAGAMSLLILETEGLVQVANIANTLRSLRADCRPRRFVLSVGATPTATSIQTLESRTSDDPNWHRESARLRKCIDSSRRSAAGDSR